MKKMFFLFSGAAVVSACLMLSSCNNDAAKSGAAPAFSLDSAKAAIAANNAI